MSVTEGATHTVDDVLYTWPAAHGPQRALAVLALLQTGLEAAQSAVDPEPALPRHAGVVQPPDPGSHAWPIVHCESPTHRTISVPVLVAPALVAVTINGPTGRFAEGVQLQLPLASTEAVHTASPFAVTVTLWPGIPVPVIGASGLLVLAFPPLGGDVSVTAGETQRNAAVL